MYDFGCVKTLEPGVADGCKRLLLAGLREDYAEVDRALRQLDVRRETGPAVAPDFYKIWRDWLALPILAKEVFDFGASNFEREAISKLLPLAMKHMASFHPSRELVFLNRAVLGHYATLRAMRARLPVTSLFCERVPEAAQWLPGQSIPPQLQT
jgi:hypothetical protein